VSASESWPGERAEPDEEASEDVVGGYAPPEDEDTDDEIAPVVGEPDEELGEDDEEPESEPELRLAGHAPGDLDIPDDLELLEGEPRAGTRRGVGLVVAKFNGDVTNRLLESALAELERAGVARDAVTVMAVPGAFELPIGAMALAKTRRYSCIVALGCVIRGETAHFDYVAGEAASGLQLASLETGVPVAFGVLTVDTLAQAMARADKGAEAVQTALEMADLFGQLRATASK
jgi:6,7-dimethyl-8-ribityllumazine synthase